MRNIALVLSYNASKFFGWQKQPCVVTVQGTVEEAIKKITNEDVELQGASRTDRGVHAMYQVANFYTKSDIRAENLRAAISAVIPDSIIIRKAMEVSSDFNARFSAKKKTYMYIVDNSELRNPILQDRVFHFPYKLDYEKILSAKDIFIGEKDFLAISNKAECENTVRTIYEIRIERKEPIIAFYVTGNGFLYKMVRNLVGTLLDVGRGKKTIDQIRNGLEEKDRRLMGFCAPPQGLYLYSVEY